MHTYRESPKEELWTVGHWFTGTWEALKDFPTEEKAAKYVNYLNGGNEKVSADVYVYEA